jgi:hypothetical protein
LRKGIRARVLAKVNENFGRLKMRFRNGVVTGKENAGSGRLESTESWNSRLWFIGDLGAY